MTVRDIVPWKKRDDLMERAFEDFWAPMGFGRSGSELFRGLGGMSPEVDVKETARDIVVSAALPGVDKKDIHVDLTEDRLTIRAERRHEAEHKGKDGRTRREQSYGSFCRSFTLPAAVKTDQAKASYKDGVLRLELPKVKETNIRRIEID